MTTEKEISVWSEALYLALETKGDSANETKIFSQLTEIMKKKRKGYLLPVIFRKAGKNYLKRHKTELFLAREHSPDVTKKIKEKFPDFFGEKTNVEVSVQKDLIGGFRVKTSNLLFKASVKDYLDELKLKAGNG